ncbi:MAG: YceD family protein [Brevefilum sp.]
MNNSNNPLRLNVGYLYNKPIGTSREVPVDFDEIQIEDLLVRNLESIVRISRTREGLLLQVSAEALVETVCVRCLVDFFLPVEIEFEELYQFQSRHREETDLILPTDGYIDLDPLYREYLILAMPIKRLCKEDCKGLCVICGANLNETTCEHHQKPESPSEAEGKTNV